MDYRSHICDGITPSVICADNSLPLTEQGRRDENQKDVIHYSAFPFLPHLHGRRESRDLLSLPVANRRMEGHFNQPRRRLAAFPCHALHHQWEYCPGETDLPVRAVKPGPYRGSACTKLVTANCVASAATGCQPWNHGMHQQAPAAAAAWARYSMSSRKAASPDSESALQLHWKLLLVIWLTRGWEKVQRCPAAVTQIIQVVRPGISCAQALCTGPSCFVMVRTYAASQPAARLSPSHVGDPARAAVR